MRLYRGATLRLAIAPQLPAGLWAAVANVAGAGAIRQVAGTATGAGFEAELPATETAELPAGRYAVQWVFTEAGGDVAMLDGGSVDVVPSVAVDGHAAEGGLSPAERRLAAAETTLETAAASGEVSMSFEGASFTFEDRAALVAFVARLRDEVAVERLAASLA